MMDLDVVIVGAGPSGAVAATVLARAGARVRLLDRAAFPRDKLCGDTVNPGTLAILRRLGDLSRIRVLRVQHHPDHARLRQQIAEQLKALDVERIATSIKDWSDIWSREDNVPALQNDRKRRTRCAFLG